MFNKIERTNEQEEEEEAERERKKPLTIYQSIRIYVYIAIQYSTYITLLLMPRHDDVYLLYLCTHSQTAGTKSNQMKNVRTEQKAATTTTAQKKKVRQKRIKLILRVYFLHYALLMEV